MKLGLFEVKYITSEDLDDPSILIITLIIIFHQPNKEICTTINKTKSTIFC